LVEIYAVVIFGRCIQIASFILPRNNNSGYLQIIERVDPRTENKAVCGFRNGC